MNTLYTTFIGRPGLVKEEGPRGVMDWSARAIYNDVFRSMNGSRATWSSGGDFKLLENDYVLSLPNKPNLLKFGGNAQALTSSGFLHHTSFLYDWDDANMSYLTVPEKRPDYRGDRGHGGFLVKMKEVWGEGCNEVFYEAVLSRAEEAFAMEDRMTYEEVMGAVLQDVGGEEGWAEWCGGNKGPWGRLGARTRWVEDERRTKVKL